MLQEKKKPRDRYFSIYFRMLMAILVSNYIILDGQHKTVWQVLQQKNFYVSLIFSSMISFFVLEFIHQMVVLLDRRVSWNKLPLSRLVLQLVFGVALALYLNLLLVKGFFYLFNVDFEASGYMLVEFPKVKWMVGVMNFLYWIEAASPGLLTIRHFLPGKHAPGESGNFNIEDMDEKSALEDGKLAFLRGRLGTKVRIIKFEDIACLKCESLSGFIFLKDNSIYTMDYKMHDLEQIMDSKRFFRTNRGVIYAFDVIDSHRREKKEGFLILSGEINPNATRIISRDRYPDFRENYKQFRLEMGY